MTHTEAETALTVRVDLPAGASTIGYDIVIGAGILHTLGALLTAHAPAPHYGMVSDARVAGLYGDRVTAAVRSTGAQVDLVRFPGGERSKTRETWAALTDALLGHGLGRDGCLIALGGGVTTDLAGFVAATFMRGIPCVQVPTSLLAQIDASIGGKTGVDTPAGKNLVGAFLHPRLVVIDPLVLATLPDAELRSGLAEAVKHAAIADAEYLDLILRDAPRLLEREVHALTRVIVRSVRIKAAVVARDPAELGERATLNFGHTIAHAVERVTAYAVPHGFAVAMGMVVEARLGELMGLTPRGTADRIRAALSALGLPVGLPADLTADAILAAAATDKKARAGRVRFALLAEPGRAARAPHGGWTFDAAPDLVRAALTRASL
jgi:3-dehydroquinate synthase